MGTRGLTVVYLDGVHRIAQYGQWDHYPGGQGLTALSFCREHLSTFVGRETFKEAVKRTRFVDTEHVLGLYKDLGIKISKHGSVEWGEANRFARAHPQLNRDMAAEVLDFVLSSTGSVALRDELAFAADSLFCEWAWVIDLDRLQLEAYSGFCESPVPAGERFAEIALRESGEGRTQYYPVQLKAKFGFAELPTKAEFIAQLEPDDE